ncbi:Wadjet anti-phage system protein JetD domain-containing protein [Phytoactinopolyspora halotolerans]|uniref:DUF3322 and DUF2220 domain-containing protein n=1 Tax=Phytoactinopolyspora halotolerans TaxID=1981512 RepID=A0A6L9S7C4_9ACTN|nr:Wadjet anti-phage system protein JetD domain-containing protein [Phytoactinopolyspora halotolerans]NEE00863.1 hypothetical protein [Phytoactinopolyspora halotolerans]
MTEWTTPADVERRLRRRWDSGAALAALGGGVAWEPLTVPLRGPGSRDVASDLERVRSWVQSWERAAGRLGRLEYKRVGGRTVGANELPARVWVDTYEQLWSALGVRREAARFVELLDETRTRAPKLVAWMLKRPLRVLDLAAEWWTIVDVVLWVDQYGAGRPYLRQVDVSGADTKFIERHRGVVAELLDLQLDEQRIDHSRTRSDFVARYGFRDRPVYVRLRALDPDVRLAGGFSELSVRLEELVERPPECSVVYVIENDVTYLAFPPVEDAVAIFGGGYGVSSLEHLTWLAERDLIYWGDIDTHGFAILDRLRRHFPRARSMLMDRATLLAHEGQWVKEDSPYVAHLDGLRPDEADLYRDLVEDAFGPAVRLEQERISYSAIRRMLDTL